MEDNAMMDLARTPFVTISRLRSLGNHSQENCVEDLPPTNSSKENRKLHILDHPLSPFQLHPDCDHNAHYHWMRRKETSSQPITCLKKQSEISPEFRKSLLEWLIGIGIEDELTGDTLHMMVNIVDRYIEKRQCDITTKEYDLVGVTCLLVAAKQVESHAFSVKSCQYLLCDDSYSTETILGVERDILLSLQFEVFVPTCVSFLDFYIVHGNVTGISLAGDNGPLRDIPMKKRKTTLRQVHLRARAYLDIGVCNYAFSQYLPSIAAEAALCMAVDRLNLPRHSNAPKAPYTRPTEDLEQLAQLARNPNEESSRSVSRYDAINFCVYSLEEAVSQSHLANNLPKILNLISKENVYNLVSDQ